jgi:restriction endonuclease S subunit
MGRSTVHYADSETNNILKRLHNKLRPAGTPVERVEYIIELLLLRIFEVKLKQDESFAPLRKLFDGESYRLLFSHLLSLSGDQVLSELNKNHFPFYASILSKSRSVFDGNLPTKIHDHLVLMEEVFANSNFTNNVKGGVLSEVIGMVNDINEHAILKTDLLGDAIESALSETGGTKDLGLYRTPGHIRKLMVEMVDPDFTDIIFDPACGTAGFLFNAFEHVIEKARMTRQFPAENIANQFYRVGISGIEYQGRIRKMAAVNMYIRGLNPHNIEQGDSLKMYDPSQDSNSKSVVIANPPFGAERDQPSYPNVWEDYAKESETTILFVKLMFDLLKKSGRCAVVVSEGFLTWGQNSACALRKMLIQEANLKAIISLPQGVFVSKSGQGAKTSILYFEKGVPTDFVWYYKIINDGFSMGTNRKPIEGSQFPELLEIFKKVKKGKKPRDTKHSFCIPGDWIETLDPRVAERIRIETKDKLIEKNKKKRVKLIEGLDKKLTNKKISKALYDEKLWQFDNVVEAQIENEITKQIEKAHAYHFNLQNYLGNLSNEQIREWQSVCHSEQSEESQDLSIEKKYQELKTADSKTALQVLASFDTQNAMHMDIAREYLNKLQKSILDKDKKLKRIDHILKEGFQYPLVTLENLITPKYEKIKKDEYKGNYDIVKKISFEDGKIHLREIRETGMDLYKANKGGLITSKINVHQGAAAISPGDLVCSTHYQVYEINLEEAISNYLLLIIRSKKFLESINLEKAGGIKKESGAKFLLQFKIPLPSLDIQEEIVKKIEKQKQIIVGAERIEEGWQIDQKIFSGNKKNLKELASIQRGKFSVRPRNDPAYYNGDHPFIQINDIPRGSEKYVSNYSQSLNEKGIEVSKKFGKGTLVMSIASSIGEVGILDFDSYFPDSIVGIQANEKSTNDYLFWYFRAYQSEVDALSSIATQKNINVEKLNDFQILLPPLEIQRQIIEKLDRQMQALEGVRLLRKEAERRIEEILAEVWGEGEIQKE